MGEQGAQRDVLVPDFFERDAVARTQARGQFLDFRGAGHPLRGMERLVNSQQLIVGTELQLFDVAKREGLGKESEEVADLALRCPWKGTAPQAALGGPGTEGIADLPER